MMTQLFCWQLQSCLATFASRYAQILPKYQLGQPVKCHFTDDDGIYYGCDRGIVIGVLAVHEGHSPQPVYFVWWLEMGTAPYLTLPHVSEILESDLEAD